MKDYKVWTVNNEYDLIGDVYDKGHGVKSIKIEKDRAGHATGYWKGITATEAQKFTFSVGIVNTDSSSQANSGAERL